MGPELPGNAHDLEPLPERLLRLRGERGTVDYISRSVLSRRTVGYDGRGISEETIKAIENGSSTQPGIKTLEAIAHGLGVPPDSFPEYRLAQARRRLDEREVGLEEALAMLEAVDEALMYPRGAELLERLEAERSAASAQQRPASRRARRKTPAS